MNNLTPERAEELANLFETSEIAAYLRAFAEMSRDLAVMDAYAAAKVEMSRQMLSEGYDADALNAVVNACDAARDAWNARRFAMLKTRMAALNEEV